MASPNPSDASKTSPAPANTLSDSGNPIKNATSPATQSRILLKRILIFPFCPSARGRVHLDCAFASRQRLGRWMEYRHAPTVVNNLGHL